MVGDIVSQPAEGAEGMQGPATVVAISNEIFNNNYETGQISMTTFKNWYRQAFCIQTGAGILHLTSDGLSDSRPADSMVINHMSPYLFTKTLLPLIESTALHPGSDVRIVDVSSVAHRWVPNPRYDSLDAFNDDFANIWKPKTNLYGYTKLVNVLWTKELQRSFNRANIPILAMTIHPGNVMSVSDVWNDYKLGLFAVLHQPIRWGYTPAWTAASRAIAEDRRKYTGAYLVPFGVIEEASENAWREDLAKDLLATTDAVLKQYDYA
ncbi:uncharacterized protein ARMOST_10338 [Armillaria ostoyae]|uniref:Uncharacterized protein n=1 Tax=Armillaria ostoyae TaxID=47428 RepID=A0A284RE24_ARMOS|nr:uncharacterized protein ARMOST_10338 [Armillaria ostoyae]